MSASTASSSHLAFLDSKSNVVMNGARRNDGNYESFLTNYESNAQNPLFSRKNIGKYRNKAIIDENDVSNNIQNNTSNSRFSDLTDLVIVAGHAIYSGTNFKECSNPNNWRLQTHQRNENHLSAFLEHIAAGISLTYNNPNAMLMFSGGETRTDVGPISEASSYWKIAKNCNYNGFSKFDMIENRVFTEEHAMDSFQNMLFSICRFYEITGNYPSNIYVVTWSFKKLRFENLHRKAIMYPKSQFNFMGVDGNVTITDNAWQWEQKAVSSFREDLFGCSNERLANVRVIRNPYFRAIPYPHQCPHISNLFQLCPQVNEMNLISQNIQLPWTIEL